MVKPDSKPTLDEIAKLLQSKPDLKLKIVGHTDNKGTAEYNLDLSTRRAANVVAALTGSYAIAPDQLASEGAGLTQPIASNDTEEGRAKNRRVELVVQGAASAQARSPQIVIPDASQPQATPNPQEAPQLKPSTE